MSYLNSIIRHLGQYDMTDLKPGADGQIWFSELTFNIISSTKTLALKNVIQSVEILRIMTKM